MITARQYTGISPVGPLERGVLTEGEVLEWKLNLLWMRALKLKGRPQDTPFTQHLSVFHEDPYTICLIRAEAGGDILSFGISKRLRFEHHTNARNSLLCFEASSLLFGCAFDCKKSRVQELNQASEKMQDLGMRLYAGRPCKADDPAPYIGACNAIKRAFVQYLTYWC